MRSSSPFETVRCPSCNEPRRISARQARRGVTLCRSCRYPPKIQEPNPSAIRWWLRNYSDDELAAIATDLTGIVVSATGIRRQRQVLTASADIEDDE